MPESFETRLTRWRFNFFPAYRRSGARVTYIASDWREVRIVLPLNVATRNYVGTMYGGAMYSAVDPIYMIMLIKLLGPAYLVWDKAAHIRFRRPGRTALFAVFRMPRAETNAIIRELERCSKVDREYSVTLVDREGTTHAEIQKVVQVRRRDTEKPGV